jgi:hypothetical protein
LSSAIITNESAESGLVGDRADEILTVQVTAKPSWFTPVRPLNVKNTIFIVFSFVSVASLVLCPLLAPTIEYHFGGLAVLAAGASNSQSMWDILAAANVPLFVTGVLMVVVVPIIAPLGFLHHSVALAAWSAADVFALAFFVALLQLSDYVSFIVGPFLASFFTVSATLLWPVYALTASAPLTWLLVGRIISGK